MPGREPSESLSIKRQKPTPKNTPTIQVATAPVDTKSQMGPSDLLRATVLRLAGSSSLCRLQRTSTETRGWLQTFVLLHGSVWASKSGFTHWPYSRQRRDTNFC